MSQNWPTRERDLQTARVIMEEYANERESNSLGLFEIFVDPDKKRMDYRLSGWVILLSRHFSTLYGSSQGDFITRQIITQCITQGQTVH